MELIRSTITTLSAGSKIEFNDGFLKEAIAKFIVLPIIQVS
jgi:hypothetical protein